MILGLKYQAPNFSSGDFFCGESLNSHELEFVVNHKSCFFWWKNHAPENYWDRSPQKKQQKGWAVAHHFCHVFFVEALNIGTKIVKGQIELVSDFKILTVPWSNKKGEPQRNHHQQWRRRRRRRRQQQQQKPVSSPKFKIWTERDLEIRMMHL